MKNIQTIDYSLDTIAWGAFFIWWGINELFVTLPEGIGIFGLGVILLGLNLVRFLKGIPTRTFTIILGILAFLWGGLELVGAILNLPFELPIFAILLFVLGLSLIADQFTGSKNR